MPRKSLNFKSIPLAHVLKCVLFILSWVLVPVLAESPLARAEQPVSPPSPLEVLCLNRDRIGSRLTQDTLYTLIAISGQSDCFSFALVLENVLELGVSEPMDMRVLGLLKNLRVLSLRHQSILIQERGFEPLENLNHLEVLRIQDSDVLGLPVAARLPSLLELEISSSRLVVLPEFPPDARIQRLIARSNFISNLEPLRGLEQLNYLDLELNLIVNLDPISTLTGLRRLNLGGNPIRDSSFLASLPALEVLHLNQTEIVDGTPIGRLTNLRQLGLMGLSGLSDFGFLAGLTHLEGLWLGSTGVSDIHFLSGLGNIRVLDLSGNPVLNPEWIAGLSSLQVLRLSTSAPSSELEFLGRLRSLEELSLSGADLPSLAPLRTLTQLRLLSIQHSNLRDLEGLESLANLTHLVLSANRIDDIRVFGVARLPKLRHLDLSRNLLTELISLRGVGPVESLGIAYNPITDLAGIEEFSKLTWLDLAGTRVGQLSSLPPGAPLEEVRIQETPIRVIFPLVAYAPSLKRLAAQRLPVEDWENLLQLGNLEQLFVRVPSGKSISEFMAFMSSHPNASVLMTYID